MPQNGFNTLAVHWAKLTALKLNTAMKGALNNLKKKIILNKLSLQGGSISAQLTREHARESISVQLVSGLTILDSATKMPHISFNVECHPVKLETYVVLLLGHRSQTSSDANDLEVVTGT